MGTIENTFGKLWDELETLDRDAEKARMVEIQSGFLGPERMELSELRRFQIELTKEMTREESSIGLEGYRELWSISDPDELFQRLNNDRNFEILSEYAHRASEKLDEIAAIIDASEITVQEES